MYKIYRGMSLLAMKHFALLCEHEFGSSGGLWKCDERRDTSGKFTFDITVMCEEEDQIMQKVLGLANGIRH